MNKLSFKTVEDLFLQANPLGAIWQTTSTNKGQYAVSAVYKEQGKVYEYKVKNYVQLVNKLKLDIKLIYEKDYKAYLRMIAENEQKIKKGFYESLGFFEEEGTPIQYTKEELEGMKQDIQVWKDRIAGATLV